MAIKYLSGITVDSTVLVVDSANDRVGIGTASPGFRLDVVGSDSAVARIYTTNSAQTISIGSTNQTQYTDIILPTDDGQGEIFRAGSGYSSYGGVRALNIWNSNGPIAFHPNNTGNVMYLSTTGNVGIGTTNPTTALVIQGGGAGSAAVTIQHTAASGYSGIDFFENTGTLVGSLWHANSSGVASNQNAMTLSARNVGDKVYIVAGGYDPSTSGGITVAAGNVGIGTTSPGTKLVIVGGDDAAGVGVLEIQTAGGTNLKIGGNSTYSWIQSHSSKPLYINQLGNNVILNSGGGNVGIGTTSPAVRLQVDNNTHNYIQVNSSVANVQTALNVTNSASTSRATLSWEDGTRGAYADLYSSTYLTFTTQSSEKMRITAAGTVAIGNAGSGGGYGIEINNSASTPRIDLVDNSNYTAQLKSNGLVVTLQNNSNNALVLGTNGTERARVTAAGNVGIGTTSPYSKLQVNGNITANYTDAIYLDYDADPDLYAKGFSGRNQSNNVARGLHLFSYDNDSAQGINFWTGTKASPLHAANIKNNRQLQINAYGSGTFTGTATQRLAVDASGNVIEIPIGSGPVDGNGTANYVTKWSDSDTITNSIIYDNGTNVGIGTTSPSVKLHTVGDGLFFSNTNTNLTINSNGGAASLTLTNTAGNQVIYGGIGGSNNMDFYTGSAFRVRIDASGNVGIGTTSPSYKLDVRGNLLAVGPNGGPGIIGIWEAENISYTGGSVVSDSSASGGSAWTTNGNYQLYGPYTNLPRGNYRLSVRVKVADASYTGNAVRISTYIGSVGSSQDRYIKGIDFSANDTWEMFSIPFKITGTTANNVEFYVFGLNSQNITVDYLSVTVDNDSYTAQNWGNLYVNGNVGIGTTSPGSKLHVVGGALTLNLGTAVNAAAAFQFTDDSRGLTYMPTVAGGQYNWASQNNGSALFNTLGSDWWVGVHDGAALRFSGNNSLVFYHNSSAQGIWNSTGLGIGTTSPSSKLHVSGDSYVTGQFAQGVAVGSKIAAYGAEFRSSSASAQIFFGRSGDSIGSGGIGADETSTFIVWSIPSFVKLLVVNQNGNVGINTDAPSQKLHVVGNARVTGAYYDSNNSAGSSGQVLSSTGSGTDWVTPATTTATSLYDLLPAARVAYNWTGQVVNDTWTDVFTSSTNVLTTGTWMVQMYIDDWDEGGGHYTYTYTGVMQWYQTTVNQAGEAAASEIYLHRMGHAANASVLYLRTTETNVSGGYIGKFQIKGNYSNTSNTTINFKFVKIF